MKYCFASLVLLLLASCANDAEDAIHAQNNMKILVGRPVSYAIGIWGEPMNVVPNRQGKVYIWSNVVKFMTIDERKSYDETGKVPPEAFEQKLPPCVIKVLAGSDDVIKKYAFRGDMHRCEEYNAKINDYVAAHPPEKYVNKQYIRKLDAPGDDSPVN